MTVTITDNRTVVDKFDAVTNISSPVAGESLTVFTADPAPVELSGCIGIAVSIETSEIVATITAVDQSAGILIYIWVLANGSMDTTANGGIQAVLGDGTDTIGYHLAGSDGAGFRHEDGPVGWQCLLLDTANLPATFTAVRGSEASLTLTAISEYGAQYKTLSKALGGASNCFTDVIRYGNGGITIGGGTTGARGTFAEVASDDRAATSGKAYGVFRELGTGLYGSQSFLEFGNTGTAAHFFEDTDFVVNWEERGQASGRYGLRIVANSTGQGLFILGKISGTENGTNGGALIMPASSGADFDATDTDHDEVKLYDTALKNFTGSVDFSADATLGITHDVFDCLFDTCGTINPGRVDMKNCSVVNSSATEAMILTDSLNTLLKNLNFTSDGTGHAIHVIPVGAGPFSYTFTGFTYTGYAVSNGSTGNETLLIDSASDADITVTLSGGDVPTIMEAAGYTGTFTLVTASVTTTVNVADNTGTDLENARVLVRAAAGGPEPHNATITVTRSGTTATVTHTTHGFTSADKVQVKGITDKTEDNKIQTVTVTGASTYTYTTTDSGSTSYTGTILATAVFIDGLTNVSGTISDTRSFASDQPVDGFIRKSTVSPRFKSFSVAGNTIGSVSGLTITVRMILDE